MGARFSGMAPRQEDEEEEEIIMAEEEAPDQPQGSPEEEAFFHAGRHRALKRRRGTVLSAGSRESRESQLDRYLSTPTPKKLKTTSKYIYDTLFTASHNSDVSVEAMGRTWALHKHYLKQSPYFRSMFSGAWRESEDKVIKITIADPNVDVASLNLALGSLYQDEVSVVPAQVIPVLATATLLQMESLIQKCREIMFESLNYKTAIAFLTAAETYGLLELREECMRWLQVNLLHHMPERPEALREISPAIMQEAIGSTDLFVLQTEVSIYGLLRLWTFLRIHPEWKGDAQDVVQQPHQFFVNRGKTHPEYFLDSNEGREFVPVFRQLRLTYMGNHKMDMELQIKDRIIPESWMLPIYRKNWHDMLGVDFGTEIGPSNVSLEDFEKHALRCGRIIELAGSHHVWRWTGFHMGLDLILTFDNFQLSIKRNQMSSPNNELQGLLSHAKRRRFFYKVNVASLNKQEQPVYLASSGVKKATLMMNQSTPIFDVDKKKATFPLLLSLNFLLTQPSQSLGDENNHVSDDGPDIEDVQGQA